jgi:hypothetical protein
VVVPAFAVKLKVSAPVVRPAHPAALTLIVYVSDVASVELAVLASVTMLGAVMLKPAGRAAVALDGPLTPTAITAVAELMAGLAVTVMVADAPAPVAVSQVSVGAALETAKVFACAMPEQIVSASSAANARDAWFFEIDKSILGPSFLLFTSPRRREEATRSSVADDLIGRNPKTL